MTFEAKVVWITGASSGIGEALAHAFAEAGSRLILSGRDEAKLESVRAACSRPGEHRVVPFDLADSRAVVQTAGRVVAEGPIDILVNNGGISQRATAAETTPDVDRRIMEINYFAAVTLAKAVLPGMRAQKSGHFVVISSLAGKFGAPRRSAYAASKHALQGFFDALRTEVHDEGLRVTIACPGYIRTDISKNALRGDGSEHGLMDGNQEQGLAPGEAAQTILRAIRREKSEVNVGGKELLSVYINRFFPATFQRLMRRFSDG
jgi:short-subunit dehydrogenase